MPTSAMVTMRMTLPMMAIGTASAKSAARLSHVGWVK